MSRADHWVAPDDVRASIGDAEIGSCEEVVADE